MSRILILSVGGSCEPIVNAIREYQPDFVYFFCSSGPKGSDKTVAGPGEPCGDQRKFKCPGCHRESFIGNPKGKSIVVQAELPQDKYEIVLVNDPDDLNECYCVLSSLSKHINQKFPNNPQVIANYTGGTKTMSIALALTGIMGEKWDLSLNKGSRIDLIKVSSGTDIPVMVDKWGIFCQLQMDSAKRAIEIHNYSAAESLFSELCQHPLEVSLEKKIIRARHICKAFDYWDKFDHANALNLLEKEAQGYTEYILILKKILGKIPSTGYELVVDLLLNAERRAIQAHYDDAVARLYRATELFAQIRLEKEYQISTSDLKLDQLKNDIRTYYETRVRDDGKVILGLREDYELLLRLKDPIGKVYEAQKSKIINALTKRNQSIGAHGTTPLMNNDYQLVWNVLKGFIDEMAKTINLTLEFKQLPKEIKE